MLFQFIIEDNALKLAPSIISILKITLMIKKIYTNHQTFRNEVLFPIKSTEFNLVKKMYTDNNKI